ncbi:carboxypeptidase-like regulatory domain-containing protein [Halosquirtibacter laminarini]|uniref:Carboxypeptidase-like regulatory domain-containing protein n=1 Tax=Halosquirtibacter laminarini TaxID=3374600 RepID=A0AC61NDU8_9BACT|nr:carboxypeptidase-like regulatory domain-containing protein [Prolixibacteraceae bacterium]
MQRFITLLTLIIFVLPALAQEQITIKGTVVNQKTEEPIPYANLGMLGTTTGAASDINGKFEFNVPKDAQQKDMIVSAIGYFNIKIPWNKLKTGAILKVTLKKQTISISGVDIQAQSLVVYRILRTAAKNTSKYFIQEPYSLDARYEYAQKDSTSLFSHEGNIEYTDLLGYKNISDTILYKNYGFKVSNISFNKPKNRQINHRAIFVNDLIQFDFAKWKRGVFNPNFTKEFKLMLNNKTTLNNNPVWIIEYELPEPNFEVTLDPYAKDYKGKVYINMKDTTIIKNEVWVKAMNHSPISMRHFTKEQNNSPIRYYVATNYSKEGGHYFLNSIQYSQHIEEERSSETRTNLTITNITLRPKSKTLNKYFYNWK